MKHKWEFFLVICENWHFHSWNKFRHFFWGNNEIKFDTYEWKLCGYDNQTMIACLYCHWHCWRQKLLVAWNCSFWRQNWNDENLKIYKKCRLTRPILMSQLKIIRTSFSSTLSFPLSSAQLSSQTMTFGERKFVRKVSLYFCVIAIESIWKAAATMSREGKYIIGKCIKWLRERVPFVVWNFHIR